jgi:hypothetical protein
MTYRLAQAALVLMTVVLLIVQPIPLVQLVTDATVPVRDIPVRGQFGPADLAIGIVLVLAWYAAWMATWFTSTRR